MSSRFRGCQRAAQTSAAAWFPAPGYIWSIENPASCWVRTTSKAANAPHADLQARPRPLLGWAAWTATVQAARWLENATRNKDAGIDTRSSHIFVCK